MDWFGPSVYMQTLQQPIAAYSPGLDRFVLVDYGDPVTAVRAARVFSSKMLVRFYSFSETEKMDNNNCLEWTLKKKDQQLSIQQGPYLEWYVSDELVRHAGWPVDFKDSKEQLLREQQFLLFTLHAVRAAHYADAMCNETAHDFYMNLTVQDLNLQCATDMTGIPGGFIHTVEKILYWANSIEAAQKCFSESLPQKHESQHRMRQTILFYNMLGWHPSPITT